MDENGGQLGVVDTRYALDLARERGYDLIEVAPTAKPPVCKLMDYGKFKYEQGRRDREAHKKQKVTEVKMIRLRPATDEHDLDTKIRRAIGFLKQGNKVKVTVIFRSREITHPEFARKSLDSISVAAEEVAIVEKSPSFEGRTMTMVLSPKPVQEREKGKKPAEGAAAKSGAPDGGQSAGPAGKETAPKAVVQGEPKEEKAGTPAETPGQAQAQTEASGSEPGVQMETPPASGSGEGAAETASSPA